MGRPPCCEKTGMKKGPWTPEEDIILATYIQQHGPANWRAVPTNTGLSRCGKSCRLRWTNYLRPGIKRGNFTPHEENLIIHLQALLGNRWAAIASYLPERTDNDIKNYWNTHLKKQLRRLYESDKGRWERRLQTDINMAKRALQEALSMEKPTFLYQPNPCSYAWSTENISRLLEGWMRKPSEPPAFESPNSAQLSVACGSTSTQGGIEGASSDHACCSMLRVESELSLEPDLHFSLLDTWLLDDTYGGGHHSNFMLQPVPLDENLF